VSTRLDQTKSEIMNISKLNYVFLVVSVLVSVVGQMSFKFAARAAVYNRGDSWLTILQQNAVPISVVALALALYMLGTAVWVMALRSVSVSIAFTFYSLAFVLVPVGGVLLFGEHMPRFYWPGVALIVGGVLVITRT
jgi:undecaprenyl phosphate-alpha-L-ara4N flippase subunit ArnE